MSEFPDMEITTLTPPQPQDILTLPDKEAEALIYGYVRHFDDVVSMSYARVGILCRLVQTYELHEQRIDPNTNEPCSFHRWLQIAAPRSHSTCYAALRDVEALKDMPEEQVVQIPTSNFPVVRQLSTAVRNDPKVIEAIKTKGQSDLVEHIRKTHPEQMIEHTISKRFRLEESAAQKIDEALKLAQLHGARNEAEALEMIAATAMETWKYEEAIEQAMLEAPDGEAAHNAD